MKKLSIALLFFTTLYSMAQHNAISYQRKTQTLPPVNEIMRTTIGSAVFTQEDYRYADGVVLKEVPNFRIANTHFRIPEGSILPYMYTKKDLKIYYDNSDSLSTKNNGLGIGIDKDNNVYAIYEAHILLRKKAIEGLTIEPALYLAADCISCFRHELIYSGKSQNTLHFTYREFKSEFTRPSFTQELRYDLEDGAIIGFKNTRIKVLKTDNATIDYIILNY